MTTTTTATKNELSKGEIILTFIEAYPSATRAQIAEMVGCTVGRVGEIVRQHGLAADRPQTKGASIAAYIAANPTATRNEIATACNCTVGRVGEIVRALVAA